VIYAAAERTKVSVVLLRRANRDGHTMRTFEAAAAGACLLVEDSSDHRDLFGDSVRYFRDGPSLVREAKALINDPALRAQLGASSLARMQQGQHTYKDRLRHMMDLLDQPTLRSEQR
jgi:spore maturation protein CgeB